MEKKPFMFTLSNPILIVWKSRNLGRASCVTLLCSLLTTHPYEAKKKEKNRCSKGGQALNLFKQAKFTSLENPAH